LPSPIAVAFLLSSLNTEEALSLLKLPVRNAKALADVPGLNAFPQKIESHTLLANPGEQMG